jgi:hypothetical protein
MAGPILKTTFSGEQYIEVSDESCYDGYVSEASYDDCVLTNSAEYSFDAETGDRTVIMRYCFHGTTACRWDSARCMPSTRAMDAFKIGYEHEGYSGTGDVVDVYNEAIFYDDNNQPFTNGASFNSFTDDMFLGRGTATANIFDDFNTV